MSVIQEEPVKLSHQRLITLDTLRWRCATKAACAVFNLHWLPPALLDAVGEAADVPADVELGLGDVGEDVFDTGAAKETTGGPGNVYCTGVSKIVGS